MKSASTGAVSGCVVWMILLCVLGGCLVPASYSIARSTRKTPLALKAEGAVICPQGTTPQYNSYSQTYRDNEGLNWNGSSTSLQCLDANGNVVKDDPLFFVLVWDGIGLVVGLLATLIVAFLIAAPAGVLIGRAAARFTKKPNSP